MSEAKDLIDYVNSKAYTAGAKALDQLIADLQTTANTLQTTLNNVNTNVNSVKQASGFNSVMRIKTDLFRTTGFKTAVDYSGKGRIRKLALGSDLGTARITVDGMVSTYSKTKSGYLILASPGLGEGFQESTVLGMDEIGLSIPFETLFKVEVETNQWIHVGTVFETY